MIKGNVSTVTGCKSALLKRRALGILAGAAFAGVGSSQLFAAPALFNGSVSSDFENAANWTGGTGGTGTGATGTVVPAAPAPENDTATDIGTFSGTPAANQPQLTATRSIGGLLFATAAGGWTLSSSSTANVLTVGSGGISTAGQTSGNDTINANLSLAATQTIGGGNGTLNITGSIANTGFGVANFGSSGSTGTVVLGAANTFTYDFALIGGTVRLSGAGTTGSGTNKFVGTAGTLDLNGLSDTTTTLTGAGGVVTNSNASATATFTFGILNTSGTGTNTTSTAFNNGAGVLALVKQGAENQTFNTANTYTGGLTVNGGSVRTGVATGLGQGSVTLNGVSNTAAVWTTNAGPYANNFVINGANNYLRAESSSVFNGSFTGAGTLNLVGNNTTTFNGNLSGFTGTMAVVFDESLAAGIAGSSSNNGSQHQLNLTSTTPGSASANWVVGSGTPNGTVISFLTYSGALTTPTIQMGSLAGGGSTTTTPSGIIFNNAANTIDTYQVGALNTNTTYSGALQDNGGGSLGSTTAGSLALVKVGAGTLTFSPVGSQTYSGGTTLSGGKLRLANTTGSATGSGPVADSGGTTTTLMGTGSSTGNLTVTNGSRLAPGVNTSGANGNFGSAGSLTLGSVGGMNLTSANMDYDLATTAGGSSDVIATGGTTTYGTLAFNFDELGGALDTSSAYTLISGATATAGFNAANISTTFVGGSAYTPTYFLSGNNLNVSFTTAVPEPASLGLIAAAGLLLNRRRRGV